MINWRHLVLSHILHFCFRNSWSNNEYYEKIEGWGVKCVAYPYRKFRWYGIFVTTHTVGFDAFKKTVFRIHPSKSTTHGKRERWQTVQHATFILQGNSNSSLKNEKLLYINFKVFGANPSSDMNEKFWDILAFCHQVSLLMVNEIRKRASNQSTEAASCAIAKFLEIENCEESSNGWMLLSTLNLLASGDTTLVQVVDSMEEEILNVLNLFL